MATGVRPSQPARTNDHPSVQAPHTAVPLGISEQQTTITSEPAGSSSPLAFLHTIRKLFESICVTILETIINLLSSLASFVRGGLKEEMPPDPWMLPGDTPEPAETTTQSRSNPTETPQLPTVVNTSSVPDPFFSLPIKSEEKRKIFQIVHTLGTTTTLLVWLQQNTLEQLGREIEHVHPFKFLEYILLHPTLRADLDTVRNNLLIWPRFLEGLANKLTRERQGLSNHMPGFARSLEIPPANLEPFLRSGNWQAMTFYLIDVKLGKIVLPLTPQANSTSTTPPSTGQTPLLSVSNSPIQTPPAIPSPWSQIQLSEPEKIMVADLIRSHKNMGYYAALRGDRHVDSLWDRLDQTHPLALLTHLYTTGELVTDLNLLWTYWMHRRYLMSELVKLLNRRPEADYLPHLPAFAAAVKKDQTTISAQIYLRRWPELIEVLRAPSIE